MGQRLAPGDCDNGLMGCSFRQNLMFWEHLDLKMDLKMGRESVFQMAAGRELGNGEKISDVMIGGGLGDDTSNRVLDHSDVWVRPKRRGLQ